MGEHGKESHDKHNPDHSGIGGHECYGGWDGLYICRDCGEFEFCECETEVDSQAVCKAVDILSSKALCISDKGIEFHEVSPDVSAEMRRRTHRAMEYYRRAKSAERSVAFLERLANEGGSIVSSSSCSPVEIADADACGRFYVNDNGLGFIIRPAPGTPG